MITVVLCSRTDRRHSFLKHLGHLTCLGWPICLHAKTQPFPHRAQRPALVVGPCTKHMHIQHTWTSSLQMTHPVQNPHTVALSPTGVARKDESGRKGTGTAEEGKEYWRTSKARKPPGQRKRAASWQMVLRESRPGPCPPVQRQPGLVLAHFHLDTSSRRAPASVQSDSFSLYKTKRRPSWEQGTF